MACIHHNDTQHKGRFVTPSILTLFNYADGLYAEYRYAECNDAEWRCALLTWRNARIIFCSFIMINILANLVKAHTHKI